MSNLLSVGRKLKSLSSSQTCTVSKFLGGGGQGEVYEVQWNGIPHALKWYFPQTATPEQRSNLENLIKKGAPALNFLWPLELVAPPDLAGFGYLMKLRESKFKDLIDLMKGKVDPTFQSLVRVGLELADSFRKLHFKGLCYRDISFGNGFFDPTNGAVLICDNDNVSPNSFPTQVLGTPDFMAPEIVRGEAPPSVETDLYSLAILLFYVFFIHHPLIGKKILAIRVWDLPARNKIFGTEPVYIFDPRDRSNEALPFSADPSGEAGGNALSYISLYPGFFREIFVRAFTDGLRDPTNGRVRETEWRKCLIRLGGAIFHCSNCKAENFWDDDQYQAGKKTYSCWKCKKTVILPVRLALGKNLVMLNQGAILHPHHLDDSAELDFDTIVARVVQHPKDPNLWGLRNETSGRWSLLTPDGKETSVDPGKSVPIFDNSQIRMGNVEARILFK